MTVLYGVDHSPTIAHSIHALAAQLETAVDLGEALRKAKQDLASELGQLASLKLVNAILARWHFRRRSDVVWSRPMQLVVDPSNSCNLKCPGCVHSETVRSRELFDWPGGLLTPDRFARWIHAYGPTATHAVFYNYGEPLLHSQTPAYIRMARQYLLRTSLSTNLAVSKFDPNAYVTSGLDFMILSIDGATQDVYSRFRRKGNLDTVLTNLRRLIEARRRESRGTPYLVWRFLVFAHNVHEVEAACALAREMGVDEFRAVLPDDVSWDDPSVRTIPFTPITRVFREEAWHAVATNWNEPADIGQTFAETWAGNLPQLAGNPASPLSCQWLYKNLTMDAGGRIFPCCCSPNTDGDLRFAHIDDASTDRFNSPQYRQARSWFADPYAARHAQPAGTPLPYCFGCTWSKRSDPSHEQLCDYFSALAPGILTPGVLSFLERW